MKKFKITIEEHISGIHYIEANDIGEAMQMAADKYDTGELVVEPNCYPTAKLMMAESVDGTECTEWEEF